MADSIIIVRRRQEALDRAARILGVRPPVPSAKSAPVVVREAYMAELILALAERAAGNQPEAKAGIDSAPPFRIPE